MERVQEEEKKFWIMKNFTNQWIKKSENYD